MMKIFSILGLLFFICGTMNAQPPKGKAKKGDHYGAKVNAENAIDATALKATLKSGDTLPVKVRAKVVDVCANKGCWMTLKMDDSTTAFVKMKDYAFFVPVELKGKTVVVDGKSFIKTTSVSELRHYAEDAKKSKDEVEAINKPKEEIRLMANGIVVVE